MPMYVQAHTDTDKPWLPKNVKSRISWFFPDQMGSVSPEESSELYVVKVMPLSLHKQGCLLQGF